MPGEPVDEVKATLVRVLADDQIAVEQIGEAVLSVPSALHEEIMGTIGKLSRRVLAGRTDHPYDERRRDGRQLFT